jgi:hypothetical protein
VVPTHLDSIIFKIVPETGTVENFVLHRAT